MAHITPGFSFAFLQECFVATLLILARDGEEDDDDANTGSRPFDGDNDDLDDYELWVAFKAQADILRKEVEGQQARSSQLGEWLKAAGPTSDIMPSSGPKSTRKDCRSCCRCPEHTAVRHDRGSLRKDGVLPELPYYYTKTPYINSAAWELRL